MKRTSDILREYRNLSYEEKIDILYKALEYMQEWNGRSKILCIAMALGYENTEGLDNTYTKKNKP